MPKPKRNNQNNLKKNSGDNPGNSCLRSASEKTAFEDRFKNIETHAGIQAVIDSIPAFVIIVDDRHHIVAANQMLRDSYGGNAKSIIGAYCPKLVHGLNTPFAGCPLEDAKNSNKSVEIEMFDAKSGKWLRSAVYPMNMRTDQDRELFLHIVFDITDEKSAISERKRMGNELRESEERFRAIVEQSKDGIIMEAKDGEIVLYNNSAQNIFGYTFEEVNKKGLFELILPDENKRLEIVGKVMDALECKIPFIDTQFVKKDKTKAWASFSVTPMSIGNTTYNLAIVSDITTRKEAEEMINYMAYYDVVTGLPNKTLLLDRLTLAIASVHLKNKPLAVLYSGLDNFKTILDTLGHDLADELLREAADRIKFLLSTEKTLAYLGNGEFVVLMPNIEHAEEPARFAAKVNEALKPVFKLGNHEVHMTASFGISLCPEDGTDSQDLLKNADAALSRAKEKGNGSFEFYELSMNIRSTKRLSMEGKLHKALDNDEFLLYYQPQVDIITNKINGLEALIRWQSPELGFVSPLEFIGIAEDVGLIVPIGEWVLKTACKQTREWQLKGFPLMQIGVNLSPRQFKQQTLVNDIKRVLNDTHLDPKYLELEITESMMMEESAQAVDVLNKLQEIGIKVAVDDFGTGYSSLGYLKRFPINRIKIDKIFIDTLNLSAIDKAIAQSIISVAHTLGLSVIAEGVETKEQLEILRTLECDEIQGFLFSKPLPATGIEALLLLLNDISACA